ncbi:MAG TPA: DUF222 domain-containing protein [Amnibacterium sp.]|uniref:HNH endonuclease signature motif containing protein n=1 Tax=Amnibacterium sp. TaxID=1872496 RepID=UPI002F954C4D
MTPWLARFEPAAEPIAEDASDYELLDAVEMLHRTQAALHLERAGLLAMLWSRARSDSEGDEAVLREVAMISGVSQAAAERMLTTSLVLQHGLAATREQLVDGTLPWSHVEVIAAGAKQVDAADVDRFEAEAIRLVTGAGIGQAKDRVRQLIDRMNPDGMVERHKAARAESDATLEPAANGMAWLHLYIAAVEAVAIRDRLTREAIALHGRAGETRCIGALRADVAIDLLLAALPAASDCDDQDRTRRTRSPLGIVPQVHVTVPVMTLLGESNEPGHLRGYGPIDPETARRLTAQAPSLFRVLVEPGTDTIVQVGREHYEVPIGLRRFLQLRDDRCRFPGCSRNADLCDIDHTTPWAGDGETNANNLACLCRFHHQLKERGWCAEIDDDGVMHWTSPFGRRRTTVPVVRLAA